MNGVNYRGKEPPQGNSLPRWAIPLSAHTQAGERIVKLLLTAILAIVLVMLFVAIDMGDRPYIFGLLSFIFMKFLADRWLKKEP